MQEALVGVDTEHHREDEWPWKRVSGMIESVPNMVTHLSKNC